MSQNSSRPLSKFNLILAILWLVDVVVTVAGYLILTSSNATQAEFYTSQSADYGAYFTAQSGSGLGATLIGAGVLGFIVTLAAMVVSRAVTKNTTGTAAAQEHTAATTGSTPTVTESAATTGSTPTVTESAATPAITKPAAATPTTATPATPTDEATGDKPHDGPKTAF